MITSGNAICSLLIFQCDFCWLWNDFVHVRGHGTSVLKASPLLLWQLLIFHRHTLFQLQHSPRPLTNDQSFDLIGENITGVITEGTYRKLEATGSPDVNPQPLYHRPYHHEEISKIKMDISQFGAGGREIWVTWGKEDGKGAAVFHLLVQSFFSFANNLNTPLCSACVWMWVLCAPVDGMCCACVTVGVLCLCDCGCVVPVWLWVCAPVLL